MAVTAALALSASPRHASAVPDIRLIRTARGAPAPRFVRLRYDAVVFGIRGTDEILVDLATGRFAERTDAGPASSSQGFDGVRAWSSDATGLAEIADAAEDRSLVLATSYLLAGPPRSAPHVELVSATPRMLRERLRFRELSRPIDVRIDRVTGRLTAAALRAGSSRTTLTIDGYGVARTLIVPARVDTHSDFGDVRETLRRVELPRAVSANAFVAPPPPDDTTLAGTTTVPLAMYPDGPVVTIRVDDGPPLRVLVDTGSSCTLTDAAARRSKLRLFGSATSGGVGPHLVRTWLATAKRIRIGGALLRHQPVEVITERDLAAGDRTDGIIGYEVFARLAVRFDFAHRTMQLARPAAALRPRGTRIPFVLTGGQPQVEGAVDALRGPITIDTGSGYALDVTSPTVRAHDLVHRYHATHYEAVPGIGGVLADYRAHARTVRLGAIAVHDVPIALDLGTGGALDDPSTIGNVGLPVLRRFVVVLDYRGRAMYLAAER